MVQATLTQRMFFAYAKIRMIVKDRPEHLQRRIIDGAFSIRIVNRPSNILLLG
ncbi:hypothetical protein M404DRAFT_25824 [Pisolithus tinctorius Marx 270]|uniref:Uncharacterized protein n=1 Tax=Pisolithus tinctorius Marx 270 TaxID=870435 RepID=A0A0C3J6N1_PISTI|nr:hypothetical protein M404DRAFT_25824 [Pisolithus tinctorius Marx 270]